MPNTTTEWVLALLPAIVIAFSALTVAVASWRASWRRRKGLPLPGAYRSGAQPQAYAAAKRVHVDDTEARANAAESAGLRAVDDDFRYRSPHHP